MHLLLLCVMLTKVASADDRVSAYVGESVMLPSGADPSWELTTVTWSIWANTTWIATYLSNITTVNHFYKYQGRLHLNTSTGNLEIKNLNSADETEYTVDFSNSNGESKVNKIKLNIKQRLSQPKVRRTLYPEADSCLLRLQCSSVDTGVTLSWQTEPHFQNYVEINNNLIAILNKTESNIKFTCNSRKNGDSAATTESVKCEGPPPPVTCPTQVLPPESISNVRGRSSLFFVFGMFAVALLVVSCIIQVRPSRSSRSDV